MATIYRTAGPWGSGKGVNLTPAEVDGNFWQAHQDIQAKAAQGVGISSFNVSGDQLTVVLTDHTLLGPYTLPTAHLNFRGEWAASITYYTNDIFTHGGTTYIVLMNHTSLSPFDPNQNDGAGHNFYAVLLQNAAATLPANGATGLFLRKNSATDYDTAWLPAALDDLSNVVAPTPANGDSLVFQSGNWVNQGASGGITNTIPLRTGQPLVYNGTTFTNQSKVDFPTTTGATSTTGTVTIDRSGGEVVHIALIGDTSLIFTGWPALGQFGRLVLKATNIASYQLLFPIAVKWPSGIIPQLTPAGTDIYIFMSWDGGTTVYGNVIGQSYS